MRNFKANWRVIALLSGVLGSVLWGGTNEAKASAVLKATKGSSRNLQPRAIDIHTRIDGAWAQTTVKTVYANANSTDIEADFIYSAPPAMKSGFMRRVGAVGANGTARNGRRILIFLNSKACRFWEFCPTEIGCG